MQLTINNKQYNLIFGLGFLSEMNKMKSATLSGLPTGYGGLALLNIGLNLQDPLAIVEIIKAATVYEPQKPSNLDIEIFLNEKAENGLLENLFIELAEEIKKSPMLKLAMKEEAGEVTEVPIQISQQVVQPVTEVPATPIPTMTVLPS